MNYQNKLSAKALNLGYLEINYGQLRIITLSRTAPGCDYLVTVLNGLGQRLVRRANFTRLADARKFAKHLMTDLTIDATNGVDTL
jgi:hypothetical protein